MPRVSSRRLPAGSYTWRGVALRSTRMPEFAILSSPGPSTDITSRSPPPQSPGLPQQARSEQDREADTGPKGSLRPVRCAGRILCAVAGHANAARIAARRRADSSSAAVDRAPDEERRLRTARGQGPTLSSRSILFELLARFLGRAPVHCRRFRSGKRSPVHRGVGPDGASASIQCFDFGDATERRATQTV